MEKIKLSVEGLSCSHCEHSVKSGLLEHAGIKHVEVSLSQKTVSVDFAPCHITPSDIVKIIQDIGYDVL
jgi:copper chaperone